MSRDAEFEEFWAVYPLKVGKLAAQKAYARARKLASAAELLAGAERYRLTARAPYICHGATWLNQGRWMDEAPRSAFEWVCPHQPHCTGRNDCDVKRRIAAGRAL